MCVCVCVCICVHMCARVRVFVYVCMLDDSAVVRNLIDDFFLSSLRTALVVFLIYIYVCISVCVCVCVLYMYVCFCTLPASSSDRRLIFHYAQIFLREEYNWKEIVFVRKLIQRFHSRTCLIISFELRRSSIFLFVLFFFVYIYISLFIEMLFIEQRDK